MKLEDTLSGCRNMLLRIRRGILGSLELSILNGNLGDKKFPPFESKRVSRQAGEPALHLWEMFGCVAQTRSALWVLFTAGLCALW